MLIAGNEFWISAPNLEFFDVEGNGGSGGILDGSNELLGIALDPTAPDGSFDTHPDWLLFGNGGAVDPTAGFYAVFGRTRIGGLTASNPWAAVFDFGIENEVLHELAVDNVASFVPEPGTGILMGFGLVGLALNGRRRRTS